MPWRIESVVDQPALLLSVTEGVTARRQGLTFIIAHPPDEFSSGTARILRSGGRAI